MKITIEFFGSVRHLTKIKEVNVNLTAEANLKGIVIFLSKKFPKLLSQVINPTTLELVEPYAFSMNGRYTVRNLNTRISKGDKLLLFSVDGGG